MDEDRHAHVLSICRHCGNPSNKFVGATMADARTHLRSLPSFFRSQEQFQGADIQTIDQDLLRVKINKHDLLIFSSECGGDFEECMAEWQQAIMMANMAQKLERILFDTLGKDFDPQKFFEEAQQSDGTVPHPVEDRSSHILNQINLPEDFLSQGR